MKKTYLLVVVMMLILSLLIVGCGQTGTQAPAPTQAPGGDNGPGTGDTGSNMNPPGVFPIVEEPVTLKVFVAPEPWLGDFSENWVTQQYQELTNVHIEWQQVGRDDVANRINLILASGSGLPDVFMTGINREQQVVYGEQGLFVPLNNYIDELGVGIKRMFDHDPNLQGMITAPDGNIYALPEYNECYHCDYSQKMWINETWLANLGLDKPETTEQYYEVLKAFKENDANGNGDPNDEIPLAAINGSWHGPIEGYFMNSFLYHQGTGSDRMFFDANRQLQFAPITDEWRNGLRYLKRLYDEGLMDREIFIMDTSQVRQLTENPNGNQVGSVTSGHYGQFADLAIDGARADFGPLAPLEGPEGVRYASRFLTGVNMTFLITKDCEIPEIAFRWGDGMIAHPDPTVDDHAARIFRGEEDVDWRRAQDGEVGLDGRPALFANILPYGEAHNRHWGQPRPNIETNDRRLSQVVTPGEWDHEYELFIATRDYYIPYGPELQDVIPPLFMTPDAVEEISELRTVIREYIDETVARFVTGDLDIERDWDTVVNNFKAMDVDRFVNIIQQNYDRQYGN